MTTRFIDLEKDPTQEIGRYLASKGLTPANHFGIPGLPVGLKNYGTVHYLCETKIPHVKEVLGGLLHRTVMRRSHIGAICYPKSFAGKAGWSINVFGRMYVELAMGMAEELSEKYGMDIVVKLESESPYPELTNAECQAPD